MRPCLPVLLGFCLACGPGSPGETASDSESASGDGPGSDATQGPTTSDETSESPGTTDAPGTTDTPVPTTGTPAGTCPDILAPDLDARVRDALGVPAGPIGTDLAQTLTAIEAWDVDTLAGIECFTGLQTLRLNNATVEDLGPLSGLTALQTFEVPFSDSIIDLGPLSGLANLHTLDVRGNPIGSFAPLVGVPLVTLLASDTPPGALPGLGQVTTLEVLHLWNCQLDDLGELASLVGLTELGLGDNAITDLTPLAGLTALTDLELRHNLIADLSPLAGMTGLARLSLSGNQIDDITPLAGMTAMQELFLDLNKIAAVTPLAGMTALRALYIHGNEIVDVAPLALPNLEILKIDDNQIADIGPLGAAPKLDALAISRNPLALGLDAFADHTALHGLEAHTTGLQTVPLFAPASLERLFLSNNAIVDLQPLAAYQKLDSVVLIDNAITTLAPLVDAPWLGECDLIDVTDNPLDAQTLGQIIPDMCADGIVVGATGFDGCGICMD
ncbi:leucine-rich repeat domain-containing protein [Nannocystis sp. SCPEA4]|uniref:leucine-rich repeat domain-containing protein n=1 Tax=Nannocystis sp. SCPEA4 TaxID=2996787 RepID=UPI002270FED4|nr:leucine-rich repeat domain-containing protein [Nannocystis sp. SCPEA4]MCY1060855.1 leucine-rich repeat domain-containing protein [Nannocystis sp. SCPEA4]